MVQTHCGSVNQDHIGTVNQTTGAISLPTSLSGPSGKAGGINFDLSTGILYAAMITGSKSSPRFLATIDPLTGAVTNIGATVNGLDAIAIQDGSAAPEPSSLILLSTGGFSLLFWRRRAKRNNN